MLDVLVTQIYNSILYYIGIDLYSFQATVSKSFLIL